MIDEFAKEYLHDNLRWARSDLVGKLDGLPEYDVRRPLTRTGTNLLGLVKHLTLCEAGYLGAIFDRPYPDPIPTFDDPAFDNRDHLWVTETESRTDILAGYRQACEHADATIEALPIDASDSPLVAPAARQAVQRHGPCRDRDQRGISGTPTSSGSSSTAHSARTPPRSPRRTKPTGSPTGRRSRRPPRPHAPRSAARSPARGEPSEPVVRERGPGGVHARGPVHAAAGVRRGRRRGRGPRCRVSARPSPGTGRKTSSWCSWDVPPLIAPPTRLASRASSSRGPSTRRARMRDAEARGEPLDPGLHPVGEPLAVVVVPDAADAAVARVARRRAGARGCRPTSTRCPPGERVGSVVVIWPASRKGCAGIAPARHLAERLGHLLDGVGDVDGARRRTAGAVAHGTGPLSAQSTLTVPGSSWKRRIARDGPRGQVLLGDQAAVEVGARPRRPAPRAGAANRSPSAVRTPVARPRLDLDPGHLGVAADLAAAGLEPVGQRLRSAGRRRPRAPGSRRSARASSSGCPSGPSPGASSGMSACPALPASSSRGASPPNRCRPRSAAGVSSVLTKPRPPTDRQPGQRAEAGADRRERREQRADELVADPVPRRAQLQPRLAVAGVLLLEQPRR